MDKALLVAGILYNQCMIYYLRNNEACDSSVGMYYVNYRKYALTSAYFMFVLYVFMLSRCSDTKDTTKEESSPIMRILFYLLVLVWNIMLLVYILRTMSCASKLSSINATVGKMLLVVTMFSIALDMVAIYKAYKERSEAMDKASK